MATTVEQIRIEREAREKTARERAASLPPGDYYASSEFLVNRTTRSIAVECESHWDACLVLMATRPA